MAVASDGSAKEDESDASDASSDGEQQEQGLDGEGPRGLGLFASGAGDKCIAVYSLYAC